MSKKSKKDKKDLTVSQVDRQNILNNPYALQEIERATRIKGIPFEGKTVVLKEQVSAFFEVTLRTIENYLGQHGQELAQNGYEILKGNRLKKQKLAISELNVPETDFGNITDSYPVTGGHLLIVPKRHMEDYFYLNEAEKKTLTP